jgi:hypothetical protein
MKHTIVNGLAYRLDAQYAHRETGVTVDLLTTWPASRNADAHRAFQVTLSIDELYRVLAFILAAIDDSPTEAA